MELILLSDENEVVLRLGLNDRNLNRPFEANLIMDEIRSAVQNYEPGSYELGESDL
jgi:hypothetical protein